MLQRLSACLAIVVCALCVRAQTSVGIKHVSLPNPTAYGTSTLDADVHYPKVGAGPTTAVLQVPGGLPVVVLLHGYGRMGSDYFALADHLAQNNYICVLLNTARFSPTVLEQDTRALHAALLVENATAGSFFEGSMAVDRFGLLGHSMGASVAAFVLQSAPGTPMHNPGFACALALSPVDPALAALGVVVDLPFGIVSGDGDTITPPALHAQQLYTDLTSREGLKFHYRMDLACTHMNICGLSPTNPEVFHRTRRLAVGFFDQFLGEGWSGLEAALGAEGAAERRLQSLEHATFVPQMWSDRGLHVGSQTRLGVVAEAGAIGLLASPQLASVPVPTAIGWFALDPFAFHKLGVVQSPNGLAEFVVSVPASASLVGTPLAVQCYGPTVNDPVWFGSAVQFVIEP